MITKNKFIPDNLKLKYKVIWWQDVYHRTNVSLILCGLVYPLGVDISSSFEVTGEGLYQFLSAVSYFGVSDEENLVAEKDFNTHQIINEEELDYIYYEQDSVGNSTGKLIQVVIQ